MHIRTRAGGESGHAIVTENIEKSLIVSALRHEDFEMPPTRKLPEAVIEDYIRWIEMGAPFRTRNYPRPYAWCYRNWVIDALNDDKPYDAFVREQIAGDLLEHAKFADQQGRQTSRLRPKYWGRVTDSGRAAIAA